MTFTEDDKRRITDAAEGRLSDVISDFMTLEMKPNGHTMTGTCPKCGDSKGFELNTGKQMFGCFKCHGISGKNALSFLMYGQNKSYPEALEYLAHKFTVILDAESVTARAAVEAKKKKAEPALIPGRKPKAKKTEETQVAEVASFCATQLVESGLCPEDVESTVYRDDSKESIFKSKTFKAGTIKSNGEIDPKGNDMIIEYYDLAGFPVMYEKRDGKGKLTGAMQEYYRVRWQFPGDHLDKDGKPYKYKSPYGGGTPIFIPQKIRALYNAGLSIEKLFIQEGEKKAEKACKHGLYSIGISGIQNLGQNGQLPEDLVKIIQVCQVKEVIFLMDSDWNDISENIKITDNVDKRPRNFFYACRNFKDYMRSLKNRNIYVEIYVGHTEKNVNGDKGIDDLLTKSLQGRENELLEDVNTLINTKDLKGKYMELFKVTSWTDHKLEELWSLNSYKKFAELHMNVLKNLPEFQIGRHRWRINKEGALESAQPIEEDEQFWEEMHKTDRSGNDRVDIEFRYVPCRRFLQNRGFGRFRRLDGSFQFIHLTPPTVRTIDASEARDYLFEFVEANCSERINEMISKGVSQYVGPDKLSLLKFIDVNFLKPSREQQYFYFKNSCWLISANEVKTMGYENVTHHIWKEQMIGFNYNYIGRPMIEFTNEDGIYSYTMTPEGKNTHFLRFLENASNFSWRKEQAIAAGEDVVITDEEKSENAMHLLSKMCAMGFLMMEVKDASVARAVIGMDGKQSDVGDSNGRSGKSLLGEGIRAVIPADYISGKNPNIFQDQFIWNGIQENTRLEFIDDIRQSFDFEFLFPNITGDWVVNYKGGRRITFPFSQSCKIYIATNHAIKGSGSSFTDRQWLLAFSDFYSDKHKPTDDFGCMFFTEWDYEQWNLYWNMLATCVQLYLKWGVVQASGERLEQRKLRQEITESYIMWADEYFGGENNPHRNSRISRKTLQDLFYESDPNQRRFVTPTEFKKKFIKYCTWAGYTFNPHKYDPLTGLPHQFDTDGRAIIDDKSAGVEYFTVGDQSFSDKAKRVSEQTNIPLSEYVPPTQTQFSYQAAKEDVSPEKLPF